MKSDGVESLSFKKREKLNGYQAKTLRISGPLCGKLELALQFQAGSADGGSAAAPGLVAGLPDVPMVHAAKGWRHHEISQVNVEEMKETWQGARELGFGLPEEI